MHGSSFGIPVSTLDGVECAERGGGRDGVQTPTQQRMCSARTDNQSAVVQATSDAAACGLPLVAWEPSMSLSALTGFLADVTAPTLFFFGDQAANGCALGKAP